MANVHPNHVYEDYNPATAMVPEEGYDGILVFLPGFKEEQLKVQLTPSGVLQISGERLTSEKEGKWLRFQKEFTITPNCDTNNIVAKFEDGVLYIIQPKLITQAPPQPQPQPYAEKRPHAEEKQLVDSLGLPDDYPMPMRKHFVPPSDFYKEEKKGLGGSAPEEESQTMRKTGIPDPSPMPMPMPMQMEKPTLQRFEPGPQLQQQPTIPSDFHKEEGKGLSGSAPDQLLKQGDRHSDSHLFKWLVVSHLMVLIVGFYILQMFKSFTG